MAQLRGGSDGWSCRRLTPGNRWHDGCIDRTTGGDWTGRDSGGEESRPVLLSP